MEAHYLYVYQMNFTFKISHIIYFLHFIMLWNLMIQKGRWQPKKKWYRKMIKSIAQHSYFQKKPNNRWVDFKTTHELDGCTQNLHVHQLA